MSNCLLIFHIKGHSPIPFFLGNKCNLTEKLITKEDRIGSRGFAEETTEEGVFLLISYCGWLPLVASLLRCCLFSLVFALLGEQNRKIGGGGVGRLRKEIISWIGMRGVCRKNNK